MNKKDRRSTSANYMVDNLYSVGKNLSQREVKCILMVRKVVKEKELLLDYCYGYSDTNNFIFLFFYFLLFLLILLYFFFFLYFIFLERR